MCCITPSPKYEISEIDLCLVNDPVLIYTFYSSINQTVYSLHGMTGRSGPTFFENPAFLLQQSRTAFRKPFSAQLPAKLETPGCPGDLAGGGGGGHGGEGRGDRGGCCEQGCEAWSS